MRRTLIRVVSLLSLTLLFGSFSGVQTASAQTGVSVLSQDGDGVRLQFTFDWKDSLVSFVDSVDADVWNHELLQAASGGQLFTSHTVDLPVLALPQIQVVQQSFDETDAPVGLPKDDLFAGRSVAWASGLGIQRKTPQANVVVMPFQLDADQSTLRRLRELVVDVRFNRVAPANQRSGVSDSAAKRRITESVLASGSVFRISITEHGVYRITRSLLQGLGLNPDTIDPGDIQLYGNGGRPLPARNDVPRIDDYREIPVQRVGAGDGNFGTGDQVIFYASAPQGWHMVDGEMEHFVHPFSNDNAVLLKIGSTGAVLGVDADPATASAPIFSSTKGRHYIEVEEAIWSREHGSGHDWMSFRIQSGGQRAVYSNLNLPGLMAGTVEFDARVAIGSNPRATIAMVADGTTLAQRTANRAFGNSSEEPTAAISEFSFIQPVVAGQALNLTMQLLNSSNDPEAALDWLRMTYERELAASEGWLHFFTRDNQNVAQRFQMSGFATQPRVWDVTNGLVQHAYFVEGGAGQGTWVAHIPVQATTDPRELVAFTDDAVVDVTSEQTRAMTNQNLHGIGTFPELVIVSPESFLTSAERLAAHRRAQGLDVLVVTQNQVFNEFSGSVPDMRAVRDFMKYLYDRSANPDLAPKYLLLFGDGHYDFRGISGYQNPLENHIFPFETEESTQTAGSYTSDDYFGLLDDNEGEWVFTSIFDESFERVDLGIGRLPMQTPFEAETMVDKLIRYDDPETFGTWRASYTAVADDGPTGLAATQDDADLHLANIDQVTELITDEILPQINMRKIYGETYDRVFLNGYRIPDARADILEAIERGTLVVNYSGHGGPNGLAQEAIFTREDAAALTNGDRQPIVITATCSWGWWDLEEDQSGAEIMLLNPAGGAIAMLTAVRLAYTSSSTSSLNAGLNRELNRQLFIPDGTQARTIGDALRETKNTEVGLEGNSRKFNLLGDPSMRIGLPSGRAVVEELNGDDLSQTQSQMRALDRVSIRGSVQSATGAVDASFNGLVNVSVFDAERRVPILRRVYSPESFFRQREDLLWRGDVRAVAGQFEAEFVVPKDISYTNLPGRIAVYASHDGEQAIGYSENFLVGGTSDNPPNDQVGPQMRLFLNDTTFVDGGTVPEDPELIVKLFDDSGINTVGTGVGHEILLSIDGDEESAVDIGSAFTAAPNSFQEGEIRWNVVGLDAGAHVLSVRAWDVLNNSSTSDLSFSVATNEVLDVTNVYNYPNPMNRETRFVLEHNQPPGTPAEVQIRIYTLSGRPIRTIHSDEALPGGTLGSGPLMVHWDGRDDDLDRPATGVYLYRIRVAVDQGNGQRQVSEHVDRIAIIR